MSEHDPLSTESVADSLSSPAPAAPAVSAPRTTPPAHMLDLAELPETYGRDEVTLLSRDPSWYFVYWEVTEAGQQAAAEQLGPASTQAKLVLRLFLTTTAGREHREIRDLPLAHRHGRRHLEASRPHLQIRAAVGLLTPEGYFAPIAHSQPLRLHSVPAAPPVSAKPVQWLHVTPASPSSHERILATPPPPEYTERLPATHASAANTAATQTKNSAAQTHALNSDGANHLGSGSGLGLGTAGGSSEGGG